MFVVFEGIDGSGKTTVSNRAARRLRARGVAVEHVREDGEFASPLVRRMREFGRDPRNLALEPWPELLFYLAREAQIQAELTRPALARGGVVFADRYLYSCEVLGHDARGLPRERVRGVIDALAGGLWPDLVVLLDVDPHVARARRRTSKIQVRATGRQPGGSSRKGLAGVGAQRRMRDGYLEIAARESERWMVVDNGSVDADLDGVVDRVCDAVIARLGRSPGVSGPPPSPEPVRTEPPARWSEVAGTLDRARERFFAQVKARAGVEPAVAAYFLAGLSHPIAHQWRRRLADAAPHAVAYGLRGLSDPGAWELREALIDRAPHFVARSVDGIRVEGPRADAMRRSLAEAQPQAVLSTLSGNDGDTAWELRSLLAGRELAAVVASLGRLDGPRPWSLRERFLAGSGGDGALTLPATATPLVASLRGVAGEEAWRLRRLAFDAAPIAVLESLTDLHDDESWAWRTRWLDRAPKVVLGTVSRLDDPRAWGMRRRQAPAVKEALDSMIGLDGDEAWAIRDAVADRWPSTAVKSLGPLFATPRGLALAARLHAGHPADLSLLKHVTALAHDAGAGAALWEEVG